MAGTLKGGKKAVATTKKRYGEDFYAKMGARGGAKGNADGAFGKGFAADPKRARTAGKKGGMISDRSYDPKLSLEARRKLVEAKLKERQKESHKRRLLGRLYSI